MFVDLLSGDNSDGGDFGGTGTIGGAPVGFFGRPLPFAFDDVSSVGSGGNNRQTLTDEDAEDRKSVV